MLIVYAPSDRDSYQSMPPELMEKYKEQFKKPERFFRYCGKTVAVPIAERRGEEAR